MATNPFAKSSGDTGQSFKNLLSQIRLASQPIQGPTAPTSGGAGLGRGLTGEQAWRDSQLGAGVSGPVKGDYGEIVRNAAASRPSSAPEQYSRLGTSASDTARAAITGTGSTGSTGGGGGTIQPDAAAAVSGTGGNTIQDTTGFGALFDKAALNEAWADPQSVINAWLQHRDRPTDTPGAAMTQEFADNLALLFYIANNFSTNDPHGHQDYLNWVGQYLENLETPGAAHMLNPEQIWSTILNPGEDTIMHTNLYGQGIGASDQVNALLKTARYGLEQYVPALGLDAQLAHIDKLGQQYRADVLTNRNGAKDKTFQQYLAENGFSV